MTMGDLGVDAERFQAVRPLIAVTGNLLLWEEFELRGISFEILPYIFSALPMQPPPVPPAPPAARDPYPYSLQFPTRLLHHRMRPRKRVRELTLESTWW